tara:strand:+ start:12891 stop:13241 length:351 start_codon:yes stop_codon:yes gene_type:complete
MEEAADWMSTSWTQCDHKITIKNVLDYIGDDVLELNVAWLSQQLLDPPTLDPSRLAAASLEYPIIIVKKDGRYKYILDGNHRFKKAADDGVLDITVRVLDLNNQSVPELFKKVFCC